MTEILSDWLKFATMHPLQERVVESGVCPKCHTKTLASKHVGGEIEWFQCSTCLNVYGLPERRLVG
jgi:hypothetical protein